MEMNLVDLGNSSGAVFDSDDSVADPSYDGQEQQQSCVRKRKSIEYSQRNFSSLLPPPTKKMRLLQEAEIKPLFDGKFFGSLQQIEGSELGITAGCQICHIKIKGSLNVTSNFTKHLKTSHPESYEQYTQEKVSSTRKRLRTEQQSKQEKLDSNILDYLINAVLPLSTVENVCFKKIITDLAPGTTVMSRPTVMRALDAKYDEMKSTICDLISSNRYFCTTADIWCARHRSFLGYTCHWLDRELKRHSVALACKRFPGTHCAERIADLISEINAHFGLNRVNIIATVTDNGSNFVKAFKAFGVESICAFGIEDDEIHQDPTTHNEPSGDDHSELPEFNNEEMRLILPKHMRCASHTLNLLATTDFLKILKDEGDLFRKQQKVMKKCNNLWKKNNLPKSAEMIKGMLGTSLVIPVITRWNSLYDAISRILLHKEKINDLCTSLLIDRISQSDLQYLEEYCILMKPITQALDFLQQERNLLFAWMIPVLVTLKTKLKKINLSNELQTLKGVVTKLEDALVTRFKPYYYLKPEVDVAIVSSVLHPSIKLKWFSALHNIQQSRTREGVENLVVRYARALAQDEDLLDSDLEDECHAENSHTQATFIDYGNDDMG